MTDLLLDMVAKAAKQDQAFLIDLAALQEKHIETAKQLLGEGPALNAFASRLLDDIGNLKAMLHAISIGKVLRGRIVLPLVSKWCALLYVDVGKVGGKLHVQALPRILCLALSTFGQPAEYGEHRKVCSYRHTMHIICTALKTLGIVHSHEY